VEELARKMLLSAVVVLIDEGSPLQVTLAVLVSGWAHVLHAMYKPWGAGSVLYGLQHGSLFVTSFVFLMGLLFKVDGVSSSTTTHRALSGIMLALCTMFITAWVAVAAKEMVVMWRALRPAAAVASPAGIRSLSTSISAVSVPTTGHSKRSSCNRDDSTGRITAVKSGRAGNTGDASGTATPQFVVTNPIPRLALYSKVQRMSGRRLSARRTVDNASTCDYATQRAISDCEGVVSSGAFETVGARRDVDAPTHPAEPTWHADASVAEVKAVLRDGSGLCTSNPVYASRSTRRLRPLRALQTTPQTTAAVEALDSRRHELHRDPLGTNKSGGRG
jgi:hypothetical protein